jgi:hypothetical protein
LLALSEKLIGSNDRPINIFYKDRAGYESRQKDFVPPVFWNKFPGEKHESGMLGIGRRALEVQKNTERSLNRFRNIGYGVLAASVIALLGIILPIWYGKIGNMSDATAAEIKTEIRSLRDQVQQQQVQIETLSARGAGANPPTQVPANTKKGR